MSTEGKRLVISISVCVCHYVCEWMFFEQNITPNVNINDEISTYTPHELKICSCDHIFEVH